MEMAHVRLHFPLCNHHKVCWTEMCKTFSNVLFNQISVSTMENFFCERVNFVQTTNIGAAKLPQTSKTIKWAALIAQISAAKCYKIWQYKIMSPAKLATTTPKMQRLQERMRMEEWKTPVGHCNYSFIIYMCILLRYITKEYKSNKYKQRYLVNIILPQKNKRIS